MGAEFEKGTNTRHGNSCGFDQLAQGYKLHVSSAPTVGDTAIVHKARVGGDARVSAHPGVKTQAAQQGGEHGLHRTVGHPVKRCVEDLGWTFGVQGVRAWVARQHTGYQHRCGTVLEQIFTRAPDEYVTCPLPFDCPRA